MNDKEFRPIEELSYKEASIELEQIVRSLESGSLELEDSIRTYTRGVELLKSLKSRIAEAEERVKALLEDNPVTVG
ncbi:MAG: exodeoxyribonuclease VII small subunit [Atopobiaceae bacterium]|nr:exodeoxyribonuclease VII small subunit [Atopobiaceae bacterium]